jgi:hypothetical protein
MDQEQKKRLDEIGFEVQGKAIMETNWNLKYNQLRDYYEKYGHCEFFGLSTV